MTGVMYQGYASYLQAYQRHANPYGHSSLALNHVDKKYRVHDVTVTAVGGSPAPSTPDQQYTSVAGAASNAAVPHQASNPTQAAASAVVCSSPASQQQQPQPQPQPQPQQAHTAATQHQTQQQQQQQQQQASQQQQQQHGLKTESKNGDTHADAHYISANCVVLTYFSGDLATAVDEHFSRALSQSYGKASKEPCPMSQRNFP
ncbi:uncharacterized protein LOC143041698, partial [Oratosquilla oratoria]|uniref:uncharacterized protein LOC143041698 n=1 Tax=Oratosquilla oratoria TaxID=337810 RepID=UPI003F768488